MPSGDTSDTVRLADVLQRCETVPLHGKLFFWYFAGAEKNPRTAEKKLRSVIFFSKCEKNVYFTTTLRQTREIVSSSKVQKYYSSIAYRKLGTPTTNGGFNTEFRKKINAGRRRCTRTGSKWFSDVTESLGRIQRVCN